MVISTPTSKGHRRSSERTGRGDVEREKHGAYHGGQMGEKGRNKGVENGGMAMYKVLRSLRPMYIAPNSLRNVTRERGANKAWNREEHGAETRDINGMEKWVSRTSHKAGFVSRH